MGLETGLVARNPFGLAGSRGNLAIERHTGFKNHEGTLRLHPMIVGSIQLFRLSLRNPCGDRQSGPTECCGAFSFDRWIRIMRGDHHAPNAGSNDSRHTGWCAFSEMTTGFKRHIERGAIRTLACLAECKNFSVRETGTKMKPLSDDPSSVDDDGPDHRIGTCCAAALRREAKRLGHVLKILYAVGHRFLRATRDRLRRDRADVAGFSPFLASASANAAW